MSPPRYDLSLNPPYLIDFSAKLAGKRVSATKRRIAFRFGFSDARAISAGRGGSECRGEEHEVVLVWSHVSGKRELFLDGRQVHADKEGRGLSAFEHTLMAFGGHILRVVASGTPPMGEQAAYAKQFDLELDGLSFFDFAKIQELGRIGTGAGEKKGPARLKAVGYSYRGAAYDARDEEEEKKDELPPSVDLLDAPPPQSVPPLPQRSGYRPSNSVPSLAGSAASSSSGASYQSYDRLAPVVPGNSGQKSFDSIASSIMSSYGAATPPAKSTSTEPVRPLAKPAVESLHRRNSMPAWALAGGSPALAEMRNAQGGGPAGGFARSQSQTAAQFQQPQYHAAAYQIQHQQQGPAAYQGAARSHLQPMVQLQQPQYHAPAYQTQQRQQGPAAYQGAATAPAHGGYYGAPGPATGYAPAY